MRFFNKVGLILALAMAFAATALANSAYSVVNPGYTQGKLGTINSAGMVTSSVIPGTGFLNGAPSIHSFTDANGQPRVLAYNYLYGSSPDPEVVIYNPTTTPWTPVKTIPNLAGNDITNLYGIATLGSNLYAVDYDTAKIVKINMAGDAYTVSGIYTFPGTAGYDKHGMAIAAVGDYVYGLFSEVINPWTTATYLNSKVVKLNKDTLAPVGTPVEVGKNAFTLKHYNNKLYVASIGGKQKNDGTSNVGESKLNVVNLANMMVTTPFTAGPTIPYDFRDIAISNTGNAYILVGSYNSSYNMNGRVYQTTVAGIDSGSIGAPLENLNNVPGYYWALLYDNAAGRLWFAKGNQIDLRNGANYAPVRLNMFASSILGNADYPNLNSVTVLGQAGTLQGYHDPGMAGALKARRLQNK
jgi:hypothetical protein